MASKLETNVLYRPLDKSRREIRLLRVVDEAPDGLIRCSLEHASLDDNVQFAALSYVWGDARHKTNIAVNGQPMAVTRNLGSVLQTLRNFARGTQAVAQEDSGKNYGVVDDGQALSDVGCGVLPLWVDAVCINQTDLLERSHQVSMMGDIYSSCKCTLAWLGAPDERNIHHALGAVRQAAPSLDNNPWEDDTRKWFDVDRFFKWILNDPRLCVLDNPGGHFGNKCWDGFRNLQELEYFRRIWIIQENILPKAVLFFCGEEWAYLRTLQALRFWVNRFRSEIKSGEPLQKLEFDLYHLLQRTPMEFLSLARADMMNVVSGLSPPWFKYFIFMSFAHSCAATDPRDKIYGLLGVWPLGVVPDYTKSVAEVYLDCLANPGMKMQPAQLVVMAGIGLYPSPDPSLPSWVPDLQRIPSQFNGLSMTLASIEGSPSPAILAPRLNEDRSMTCFGIECTHVVEVASRSLNCPDGLVTTLSSKKLGSVILSYLASHTAMVRKGQHPTGDRWIMAFLKVLLWPQLQEKIRQLDRFATFSARSLFDALLRALRAWHSSDAEAANEFAPSGFATDEEMWAHMSRLSETWDQDGSTAAADIPPGSAEEQELSALLAKVDNFAVNWVLCHTADGLVGGGPAGMMVGDKICLIRGVDYPLLLRKVGEKWKNVGVCYVYGVNEGAAKTKFESGQLDDGLQEYSIY